MAPRNAVSFLTDSHYFPGKPGAVHPIYSPDGKTLLGINHACPCGCGSWSWLRLNNDGCQTFQKWDVKSGDVLHLTLEPSIGIRPQDHKGAYHWHGHLRAGVFEED